MASIDVIRKLLRGSFMAGTAILAPALSDRHGEAAAMLHAGRR